ncbi:MAG: peptidase M14 [Acidobacteria bacterium]|nr:peptidase M14 [Acidobacteriota bacterium]
MRRALVLLPLCFRLIAGPEPELWPRASYDPRIPDFRKVLGYHPGERITWHANILKYLEALAAAEPKRMRIFDYGKTWEGRRLIYAVIGSEANIARLPRIKAAMQRLADPRNTPESEARKIMAGLPALIWLAYGVHGNEISSAEAAMYTAYHLLASRDKAVAGILSNVVVLLDPQQNPDGRDRFVHNFEIAEGIEPNASPAAAEHNEPWPGGRTNHYYFDLNRDWFALTQPETRGRVKVMQEWFPLVMVDLHEMSSDSTYYFAPEADPFNPHLTRDQRESLSWFGRNNARWFDRLGFTYFTREVYDAFFPGYGASWPAYYGAIAMTYENASARGLVMRRRDNSIFSFRDTVRRHFIASISTAETAAANREKLLENFYKYRQSAIQEGGTESVREYILPRRGNVSAVDKLAATLLEQGVEIKVAGGPFRAGDKEVPAGSYVIPLAQPAKRLIRTLLDPNVPMDEAFVKEQERRRRIRLPSEIYDVTAWSLPMLYNIELIAGSGPLPANLTPLTREALPGGRVAPGDASVAYLVPWGTSAAARFLTAALRRRDLPVYSSDREFTQNGRRYPRGTLILPSAENPGGLSAAVPELARASGAEVHTTDTGWVEEGVNFGSRHVFRVTAPAVAIAWDRPTSAYSAGHTRFVLERQFNYPATVVRTRMLASSDLARFQTIILPEGNSSEYFTTLGADGVRRLKDWVSSGGTLVAIGSAVSFLADARVALLAVQAESLARPPEPGKPAEPAKPPAAVPAAQPTDAPKPARAPGRIFATREDYEKAIRADTEPPDAARGVLVKAALDQDHWLTAGAGDSVYALANGSLIFTPIKLDKGINAGLYAAPGQLVASGYLWEENRKQLAHKPFLLIQNEGRGQVIGFTADPNFRAYMDGLGILFLNAVFRGPAHSRPAP